MKSRDDVCGIAEIDGTGVENVTETEEKIGQGEYPKEISASGEARDVAKNKKRYGTKNEIGERTSSGDEPQTSLGLHGSRRDQDDFNSE